uniref:Uncharacterized protein n=1 Tax=Avena sativa TaxID=4498 RepID=A0ACD5Y0W4_AVESA
MSAEESAAVLPVGFRFRPTDEELVRHYLKAKIAGRAHPDLLAIPDVDLAAVEPWDLPARSVIKSDDPEWFFFAHRDRPKYPGKSARSSRSTAAGYWKATGKDRLIRSPRGALIGIKKTLVFHRGRAPRGTRTAWIMHEYRTTEPRFESGQNGSFVLYRLFNKHDEETPGPNPQTPSSSSRGNLPPHDDDTATTSMTQDTSSPSDSIRLTAEEASPAQLLTTDADTERTAAQEAAFLDVLTQLPDLQAEQRYDGFPTISSPMRPYTDHPFVGNMGEQDFSPFLDSIIAEQDLQDMLLNPAYAETDAGNAESRPTFVAASTDHSNNNAPHYHSQLELPPAFDPRTESHNNGAFCAANSGSWTPYPQHLLDYTVLQPSRSDMIDSNASNGEAGWEAAPLMQQSTVSELIDPQQGTAARRIRLVSTVERALASQPILKSCFESEDEAESCCSTASSSDDHDEDHVDLGSQTMAGDLMHIQGRGHNLPTQVVSSLEVADKLQHLSFNDNTLENIKPLLGAGLTRRLKHDTTQSLHRALPQNSDPVLAEPSSEKTRQPTGSVVRLLWLALLVTGPLLLLVGVWRSLNY